MYFTRIERVLKRVVEGEGHLNIFLMLNFKFIHPNISSFLVILKTECLVYW